jgi:peptidylprolyl isomerase
VRRPAALVLLPVLLAGSLTACVGGESETLPTVKGKYGSKPRVTVAKGTQPSKNLETKVLSEGDGREVQRGDLLVADYLGQIYKGGKVFDNSYDRGAPAAFNLRKQNLISAWVKALDGVPVGSRVLLVAPPKEGYGKQGNPQAGIKGSDSLVFVVDIIAAYGKKTALPESEPVSDLPAGLPQVEGEADPQVTVPQGAEPPSEPKTTVLRTGTGPEVQQGRLGVLQFTAVDWSNKPLASSWEQGPAGVPIGGEQPSPFDELIGIPVGSRVLLLIPASTGEDPATASVAVVIDVLGQHGPAKEDA